MATTKDLTHKNLVKRFHTLLSKYGVKNEEKMSLLSAFGVSSSLNLSIEQLIEVCDALDKPRETKKKHNDDESMWRKRLMAAIYSWRESLGAPATEEQVKAIACQAAEIPKGYPLNVRFNAIPIADLRTLYNAFRAMAKKVANVSELTQEMIDKLTQLN
jgi:hypothetical protein